MIFGALLRQITKRLARNRKAATGIGFEAAEAAIIAEQLNIEYRLDLARCASRNPSVIKKNEYEMYCSKNGKVYAYMLKSGERRIYPVGSI